LSSEAFRGRNKDLSLSVYGTLWHCLNSESPIYIYFFKFICFRFQSFIDSYCSEHWEDKDFPIFYSLFWIALYFLLYYC